MIIAVVIAVLAVILFFSLHYRNNFSNAMSLYFFSLLMITVTGIIYITKRTYYGTIVTFDYSLYRLLTNTRITVMAISRLYNFSFVVFMGSSVLFALSIKKMPVWSICLMFLPCVYFLFYNDPYITKYLYLSLNSASGQNSEMLQRFVGISNTFNDVIIYAYMILPLILLAVYCRRTVIFVKQKDAVVSGACLIAIDLFVYSVFINGSYSKLMFNNVNMARLPEYYQPAGSVFIIPVIFLLLLIAIIVITLIFRPFRIFSRAGRMRIINNAGNMNKNLSMVLHGYKNAFLGVGQQFQLAENHIKSKEYDKALHNTEIGEKIADEHMEMLRKTLLVMGHSGAKFTKTDIIECIKDAITEAVATYNDGIDIEFTHDDSVFVNGDASHLKEMFLNILVNSIQSLKYKECENAYIHIMQVCEEDLVLVRIRDNGTGIEKKNMHLIFQPFFSTKATGNGVGLNYVLGVVKQHQGEMKVKSEWGKYTELQIVLPLYTEKGHKKWKG